MSLTMALNTALQGLRVNQRTMAVISNNIANANTEGYSRQVVDLASVAIDGVGQGVRVKDVSRKIDEFLLTAINKQTSQLGASAVIDDYMERAQILMGEPGATNSIDEQIEIFFNAMQAMADSVDSVSLRTGVVEAAETLAREFSMLAQGIEDLRFEADRDIGIAIEEVNDILVDLATINESIAEADAFGAPKANLFDQRDLALEKLAEYLDVRSYEQENGVVHVYVGRGTSILDETLYELSYKRSSSILTLIEDNTLNPIEVQPLDAEGNPSGNPWELASGGRSSEITTGLKSGKIYGLLQLRDSILPGMLEQLDILAYTLREEINALHNNGSGYPAASELTGTRKVQASTRSAWTGEVRIAVLNKDGTPPPSAFADENGGFRPLTLDLESLDSGFGIGEPDVQTIIDEINNHFRAAASKLSLGNINQIQLSMVSDDIPGATPTIEFDFDLENISGSDSDFWVTNIAVLDDTATDITNVTYNLPNIDLDPVTTFQTVNGSNRVTVAATSATGLQVGDRIRLSDPGVSVNGIPGSDFNGYFVVQAVSGNTFDIDVATAATAAGAVSVAGQTAQPPYGTIEAGEKTRLFQNGTISANLSGNPSSSYYDITVDMAVRESDGTVSLTQVTYRINSPQADTRNDRFSATAVVSGDGVLQLPSASSPYLRALLVDEDGVELAKTNGEYGDQSGYLQIRSMNSEYTVVIDQLSSVHNGSPSDSPPIPGTGRGFSSYFELNNLFVSNEPTVTGTTVKNSALYMAVTQAILDEPTLISTGNLERSNQPADSSLDPIYTYERYSGDQTIAQQMAGLGTELLEFDAAGGLPDSTLTFNGYAGEMLGYIAAQTVSANVQLTNDELLIEGYKERSNAIRGVNLDEELANTVIYQHAYTASARVITTTDEMFQILLDMT